MKPGAVIHGQPGKKETRYLLHVTVTLCNIYTIIYTRDLSSSSFLLLPPSIADVHRSWFIFRFLSFCFDCCWSWNFGTSRKTTNLTLPSFLFYYYFQNTWSRPPILPSPPPPLGKKKQKLKNCWENSAKRRRKKQQLVGGTGAHSKKQKTKLCHDRVWDARLQTDAHFLVLLLLRATATPNRDWSRRRRRGLARPPRVSLAQYQIRGVPPNAVDLRVFLEFGTVQTQKRTWELL